MLKKFTRRDLLVFSVAIGLVVYAMYYNTQLQAENQIYFPRPLSDDDLKKYTNSDPKAIVIFPILTQNAYKDGGFYDYFKGKCSTCNVVSLRPLEINATYTTGLNSFDFLEQLHYPFITDITVDKHPEILADYDKIILLHNEYMTKNEFNAIKNHKNVIYLYPNSMYVEVAVDYEKLTMTLVRGHGYPEKQILNGFDYETSSQHEYDFNCKHYQWEARQNGIQPTCWPEFLIKSDRNVLQVIKDFPNKVPILVQTPKTYVNMSNMGNCDYTGKCTVPPPT